jgi:Tol biopolymer transport system component
MRKLVFALVPMVVFLTIQMVAAPRGVMLMNRIGPSTIDLFIANADGTGERKLFSNSDFDYNGSFSADGQWLIFTSERTGYGQADIYRSRIDGSGVERLTDSPAMDDQAALSPDGRRLAFVSTRENHTANIWVLDVATKRAHNVTGGRDVQTNEPGKPSGFFRPSWSPDGQWLAFSSDRLTEWTGHENGAGAGHRQTLSIYVIRPDGTGLKRLTDGTRSSGTPQWSADSKRVVFYEVPAGPGGRGGGFGGSALSQIVSVDIATDNRIEHTSGPGGKVRPHFVGGQRVGYLLKTVPRDSNLAPGIAYSDGAMGLAGNVRAPAWSADGKHVVYEKQNFAARPQGQVLYSWDPDYEYRYTDVFPMFSKDGVLVTTDLNSTMGNPQTSVSTWNSAGYMGRKRVFWDPSGSAMMASWSPDGKKIVFGFGAFFGGRSQRPAQIKMMNADGSNLETLTDGPVNSGFPNWSPDGKSIVYRAWGLDANKMEQRGLRLMSLADHSVKVLSNEWDNFPFFSPSGDRILFTRQKAEDKDFDVFTMKTDGSEVKRLTTSRGTDGHATWTSDGKRILFMSTRTGFKDEREMYDNSPQPYAQNFIMDVDGSNVRQLTDSRWEDSMPIYVPAK